jgi:hypothetical protein
MSVGFYIKIRLSSSFSNYFRSKSLRYFTTFIIIVVFVQTILVKFLVANIISVISHLIHKSHHRCFIIHHINCYHVLCDVYKKQKIDFFVCKTLSKTDIKIGDDICVKDYARLISECKAN